MLSLECTNLFAEKFNTAFDVACSLFHEFDCHLDVEILKRYIAQEVDVQEKLIIYRVSSQELRDYLVDFFSRSKSPRTEMSDFIFNRGMNRYAILQMERDEAVRQHNSILAELFAMKRSWSWKLGRLITYFPRLMREKAVS